MPRECLNEKKRALAQKGWKTLVRTHRRSQRGAKGPWPPKFWNLHVDCKIFWKFLKRLIIHSVLFIILLCLYSEFSWYIWWYRLIFTSGKFWPPPKFSSGYAIGSKPLWKLSMDRPRRPAHVMGRIEPTAMSVHSQAHSTLSRTVAPRFARPAFRSSCAKLTFGPPQSGVDVR